MLGSRISENIIKIVISFKVVLYAFILFNFFFLVGTTLELRVSFFMKYMGKE